MKSIGLECRSGIATAAVSLPVFLLGFCILLVFTSSTLPVFFTALLTTAIACAAILAILQCIWTKKTYAKRLQKTIQNLEDVSLGKTPVQLATERYVLCSDIKQCPEEHTMMDCLKCELYSAQNDLEKLGAIVNTLSGNINSNKLRHSHTPELGEIIDLTEREGFVRRDLVNRRR